MQFVTTDCYTRQIFWKEMTDTNTHFEDGCHVVYNLNSLYHAYLAAKKDSDWKPQVQKYEMNFLLLTRQK